MKFDETDTIAFPMSDMSTIYFLLNGDEVVYIGSSENGVPVNAQSKGGT